MARLGIKGPSAAREGFHFSRTTQVAPSIISKVAVEAWWLAIALEIHPMETSR